jgi:hypothetical protein
MVQLHPREMAFPPAAPFSPRVFPAPLPPLPMMKPLLMMVRPAGKDPVVNAGVAVLSLQM